MKKLRLDMEELRVESFRTTGAAEPQQGTVHAHERTPFTLSGDPGYSTGDCVCACDTTYTQRLPDCDPSAQTLCVSDPCLGV